MLLFLFFRLFEDTLYHLGDWSFGGIENIWNFRKRINCKNIYLVPGNHDHHIKKNKLEKPKNWILLINNNNSHSLTPPGGKYIKLNNDFFELDKKNKIKL